MVARQKNGVCMRECCFPIFVKSLPEVPVEPVPWLWEVVAVKAVGAAALIGGGGGVAVVGTAMLERLLQ